MTDPATNIFSFLRVRVNAGHVTDTDTLLNVFYDFPPTPLPVAAALPLAYMCLLSMYTVFKLKIFGMLDLSGHQHTDAYSLLVNVRFREFFAIPHLASTPPHPTHFPSPLSRLL